MTIIFDACALIAFLRDEAGADIVEAALIHESCVIHAINMCEVYKDCLVRNESSRLPVVETTGYKMSPFQG